jgi:hypothetical protein
MLKGRTSTITILVILFAMAIQGVLALDRKGTEHYNRQEFSCSQKCEEKGYLK